MKEELEVRVEGLHCAACALTIDDAVERVQGVFSAKTNVARGRTKVVFEAQLVTREQICRAIAGAGYSPLDEY